MLHNIVCLSLDQEFADLSDVTPPGTSHIGVLTPNTGGHLTSRTNRAQRLPKTSESWGAAVGLNRDLPSMNMEHDFAEIYAGKGWDDNIRSGPGSDPRLNRPYAALLQKFIREHNIRSVVDIGCGDWSFSRLIDWSGVDYVGIDVVPQLVDNLNSTYGRPGIRFIHGDVLHLDLPRANLAISKDVLQHWPSESILSFIKRLHLFNYAILTNDCKVVCRSWRRLWIGEEIFKPNSDIAAGDYRPIRLREPPFNLAAKQLAVIKMYIAKFPDPQRRPEVEHKEVLLWTNPSHGDD